MSIILPLLTIIFSFYIISKVIDEYFIKSLDGISDWLHMPKSIAGATLMAFGTSAPEIFTSLIAIFVLHQGAEIGIGSVVGSSLFNILVVIGIAAAINGIRVGWRPMLRDMIFYGISIIILHEILADSMITIFESTFMIIVYLIYTAVLLIWSFYVHEKIDPDVLDIVEDHIEQGEHRKIRVKNLTYRLFKPLDKILHIIPDPDDHPKWTIPVFFLSLLLIGIVSFVIVEAANQIAITLNIHPAIVALTIIAGGGSLPEVIATSIVAKKGYGEMAISNAVGSNIFNILLGIGLPVYIYNLINGDLTHVGIENVSSSIILMFATLIAVFVILVTHHFKAGKGLGYLMIISYVGYVIATYMGVL